MAEAKKSLKPIPPTLRGKKRYVKFELNSDVSLFEKDVKFAIWNTFSRIYGEKGVAEQKLWLIKWFPDKNEGILRCALEKLEEVKAGLLFVKEVQKEPVIPILKKVSGSIKKLS